MKLLLLAFAAILTGGPFGTAQTGTSPPGATMPGQGESSQTLAFEAATIKPVGPNDLSQVQIYPGGRVVIGNASLKVLIGVAFGVGNWQISGCTDWCEKTAYTVEAKPPDDLQPPISNLHHSFWDIEDPRLRQMLQSLLIERFQLRLHAISKLGAVYILKRNGKTIPLKPTKAPSGDGDRKADSRPYGVNFVDGRFYLFNTSMPQLARFASTYVLHSPVEDRTGLTGFFDYRSTMQVDPSTQRNDFEGSFIQFLLDIGLELKKQKGPVEAFVVDHAEMPSPN